MRNIVPLLKKEFQIYVNSFILYAVVTIFLILSGYFFFTAVIRFDTFLINERVSIQEGLFRQFFLDMVHVICLTIPLLTMRLFAEENRTGTIELLLTYPVKDMEIILAKYIACLVVFSIMLAFTGAYVFSITGIWSINIKAVLAGYLGLFLLGCAFISVGILVSSFTKDQITSAMITFGICLFFLSIAFNAGWAGFTGQKILTHLSFLEQTNKFAKGIIESASITHFVVFTVCFILFTRESLRSRYWRGLK